MGSVLAIVSKAVFEKQAAGARVGTVVALDRYASAHAALDALADGGALFLVTVRPPDEALWLVAVLESPVKKRDAWAAAANAVAIADLSAVTGQLVFASGKGVTAKRGALAMSLQTPRALTDGDVAVLRAAAGARTAATAAVPAGDAAPGRAAVDAAIARGDSAGALTAALAWWTATRAPAVADLVDAISKRVSPPAVATDNEFTRLARAKDPLDLGALLPAVPALAVSFLPTAGELLAGYPDDPRVALAVATWARDPLATSSSAYPFWTRALDAMTRARDPRTVPLLQKRLRMTPGDSKFWPKFYAALERALAKLAEVTPSAVAVPAALARSAAALPALAVDRDAPAITATEAAPALSGPLLEQATQHLAAGRVVAAIDAMVERWRTTRAADLADLIDRATRLLPSYDLPLPPIPGKSKTAADPWLAAFERDPMAAMPQLLQGINANDGRWGGIKAADRRLAELANLPDDPRVALRLAELCSLFGVSPERTQYWKSLLEQLARIADPRTWPHLRATFRDFTNTYFNHHRQAKRIVGAAAMDPPPPPVLPAADRALVGELSRAVDAAEAASLGRKLVAAIAAAWDDDAPRLVYADWLSQREHPRGEAITLDLGGDDSPSTRDRMVELQDHTPHVYGALDDLAEVAPASRERGIPTRLPIRWGTCSLNWRAAAAHPLIALVETIDVGEVQVPPDADDLRGFVAAATRLRAIERVEQDRAKMLWAFADAALPGFRRHNGNLVRR